VRVGDGPTTDAAVAVRGSDATVTLGGVARPVVWADDGATTWVHVGGATWPIAELPVERLVASGDAADAEVRSPMPGKVIAVTEAGDGPVDAGATLVVIEAMKMEHSLTAPAAGTVELLVRVGDQVERDQVVARVEPAATEEDP
jgi:acetyl-CoA/propionyl-CoA carboxylase biotin carboxyl carrier protein